VVLFLKEGGAGTLFPIVIVAGSALMLAISMLGAWIGGEMRKTGQSGG
jgi:hypothetical protein